MEDGTIIVNRKLIPFRFTVHGQRNTDYDMKVYAAGGVSGAIAGFIAGVLYALVSQEYSVISAAALAGVIGILPGIWLGKGFRRTAQATFIRRWIQWFSCLV